MAYLSSLKVSVLTEASFNDKNIILCKTSRRLLSAKDLHALSTYKLISIQTRFKKTQKCETFIAQLHA